VCVYSFQRFGRKVHLIDTPGFNDSKREETEILEEICYWLSTAYGSSGAQDSQRFLLSGIIYLHPLTEKRWTGSSQRSIDFLKALCGPENYGCLRLTTTFWDQTAPNEGIQHERQLINASERWCDIVRVGGRQAVARHDAGFRSAIRIVDSIIQQDVKYALRIQKQMAQPGTTLLETDVGRLASTTWEQDIAAFNENINEARMEIANVRASETQRELNALRSKLADREAAIAALTLDRPSLFSHYTERNRLRRVQEEEYFMEQLEQCDRKIASLERQLDGQQRDSPVSISIYNNDSASTIGDNPLERHLKEERQKKKEILTQRMAKMTNHSMRAGIAGALFGGMSMGIAALPIALAACNVM
jgi:hypothetical protein